MIFRELTEGYTPEKILFRDSQRETIKKVFQNFRNIGVAKNLLLIGGTGTGKTATLTNVLNEWGNGSYVMASGSRAYTCFRLLKTLFDLSNCNTLERAIEDSIVRLKKEPKILIIDEVNKLKDNREKTILFNTLNTINRETDCPVIVITNTPRMILKEIIPRDAQLSLSPEPVEFQRYNPLEAKEIMLDRVKLIQEKNPAIQIPEGRLEYLCAYVIRESEGSMREVRVVLMRCLMENDFSDKEVHNALKWVREQDDRDEIMNLPETEKKFLKALIDIKDRGITLNSSNFLKVLRDNSTSLESVKDIGISRISLIITEFEGRDFISTKSENKGRSGGSRRIIIPNVEYLTKIQKVWAE